MRTLMLRAFLLLVLGWSATGRLANAAEGTAPADALKMNVLFVAVDDLRSEMGCWGEHEYRGQSGKRGLGSALEEKLQAGWKVAGPFQD